MPYFYTKITGGFGWLQPGMCIHIYIDIAKDIAGFNEHFETHISDLAEILRQMYTSCRNPSRLSELRIDTERRCADAAEDLVRQTGFKQVVGFKVFLSRLY